MILNSPTISGSLTVTGNILTSGSITLSGSVASASYALSASNAQTASFANAFTVAGNLTAQTLVVQTITSSVDFVTGSTRFGSLLSNTHVFSGSITMNPNGLFVSSSGNVGIGTISPQSPLDIYLSSTGTYFRGGSDNVARQLKMFSSTTTNAGDTHTIDAQSGTGILIFATTSTERIRITAAGSILAGNSTEYRTDLSNIRFSIFNSSSNPTLSITNTTNGVGQSASIYFGQMINNGTDARPGGSIKSIAVGTYTGGVGTTYSADLAFYTSYQNSDTERIRITSAGVVAIGTTSTSTEGNLFLGGLGGDEGGQIVLQKGTSYTYATHIDNYQDRLRIMYGTNTGSSGVRFSVDMSTGFTASTTTASDSSSKTFMNALNTSCGLIPTPAGTTLYLYNRDGGTNYRALLSTSTYFTGQHGNKPVNLDLKTNLQNYIGLIVSSAGTFYSVNPITQEVTTGKDAIQISEALPEIKLTDTDQDKAVWGVVTNVKNDNYNTDGTVETDNNTEWGDRLGSNVVRVNGLGEGAVWVTNINGNIENGDYICSSIIPGYGRKQNDDLLHNYTVAKSTMDCDFDLNNNNLYVCEEFEFEGQTYKKAFVGCTYHCS